MNLTDIQVFEDPADRINELHRQIESKIRTAVDDAIELGRLLTVQKEKLEHGEFLPWLEGNCTFSQQSASNYMRLYQHHDKLPTVSNLQEAYKQIKVIESQRSISESKKSKLRVKEFLRTGKKPEGWRRGTDDRILKEEQEFQDRLRQLEEDEERARLKREESKRQREETGENIRYLNDHMEEAATAFIEKQRKVSEFKDRIRLSDGGKDDVFIDAIMQHLDSLPDDSRRIEACNNILKVVRNIANELQRKSVEGARA